MSTDKWRKENTKQYALRVTNSSGIPAALEKASIDTGMTQIEYIRNAVLEKLDFDGYIYMEAIKQKLKK